MPPNKMMMAVSPTIPRYKDHLAQALALANDLPPLSPLARHLLATISAPGEGPSLREVASWIEKDIMTSGKVLALANSALYGRLVPTLSVRKAVARLGETLIELLSPGCFRMDMRLRPGGRNSPLVTSFEGALSFYQGFGETWERAALLRARPVAGAFDVGRRLLGELGHFVYRRYLDFDTLRQLRAMKYQIERELRAPDLVARNIKLGYGGIRELEFIVQALTLVYGGRDPRLRTAHTLAALERLGALGYLNNGRARELAAAYLFLRDVEHKLQIVAALQTHVLPADEAGRSALASRPGRSPSRCWCPRR